MPAAGPGVFGCFILSSRPLNSDWGETPLVSKDFPGSLSDEQQKMQLSAGPLPDQLGSSDLPHWATLAGPSWL